MKLVGAKIVCRALREAGVRFAFGIPGTHNIELYDAFIDDPEIEPILVTDEQSAAFMADGVARATGSLAAVNLVPGAGLTHALSGIAECYLDQVPLLVLACGIRKDTGHAFQLHDIDQAAIARPVCKAVYQPKSLPELDRDLRAACRLALAPPFGPAMVEISANLFYGSVGEGELEPAAGAPASLGDSARPEPGLARAAAHAAQLLNGSRRIALYIGAGALAAQAELRELADRLDAIVFTTISGKGVFPERHERWAWATMGAAAPPPIRGLEADLDCLLAIGCRFSEVATASYGFAPPPTLVHVDIDPLALGRNYPPTLAIAADARDFARALLAEPSLSRRTPDGERLRGLARAQAAVSALQGCPAPAASEPATDASAASARAPSRVSPGALFSALQGAMGDAAVFVTDSGNGTFLAMERLRLSRPRSFLAPIDYSCMGYSIPAAIGAKLAAPDRPVIALPGDGAFLMTGLELATARQYGVGIIAFLLRDFELAQIAQFQRASLNRASCTSISNYSARAIAEATGAEYLALERDADLGATIRRAMGIASGGVPVLVETQIDYSQPSFFSKGAIKTNFLRFAWKDRLRLAGRVIGRKLLRPR